jgi:hypothetical protein
MEHPYPLSAECGNRAGREKMKKQDALNVRAPELRSDDGFGVWASVEKSLPPIEEPVWLYLPSIGQPIVGVRTLDDGGWFWARCYGDFYWTQKTAADGKPGWQTDTAEVDDLKPSHWMHLPSLPNSD